MAFLQLRGVKSEAATRLRMLRNVAREQLASIVVMLGQSWKNLEAD
jgi:hypothetical protein